MVPYVYLPKKSNVRNFCANFPSFYGFCLLWQNENVRLFQQQYTISRKPMYLPKLKNVHDHLLKNLFCLFSGNELLTIASSQWAGAFLTGGWFWQQSLRLAGNLEVGRGHQRWMRCFHSLSFSRCSIYRGKYTFLWLGPDHVTKWDFPF